MKFIKTLKKPGRRRTGDSGSGPLTGRIIPFSEDVTVRLENQLGEGGFATIYRAIDTSNNCVYAVKAFVTNGDPDRERDLRTEVSIMRALHGHPMILTLHEACSKGNEVFLLLDICDGNLAHYIMYRYDSDANGGAFSDVEVLDIFTSVAKAVCAVHELNPPKVHRDVKAENILYRPSSQSWVLCDFGSCVDVQGILSTPVEIAREEERIQKQTTPAYRAPELWDLYSREPLDLGVDAWSLGVLLYFLSFGKFPFDSESKLQILNGRYTMTEGLRNLEIENLIRSLLVTKPQDRMTCHEAVKVASDALAKVSLIESSSNSGAIEADSVPQESGDGLSVLQKSNTIMAQNASHEAAGLDSFEGGWASFDNLSLAPSNNKQEDPEAAEGISTRASHEENRAKESWDDSLGNSSNNSRPPSSLSENGTAGNIIEPTVAGGSMPMGNQDEPISTHESNTDNMYEHCQVLEKLFESRNEEVHRLQKELENQKSQSQCEISALKEEISKLRNEASTLQSQLATALESQNELLKLKSEIAGLKRSMAESKMGKGSFGNRSILRNQSTHSNEPSIQSRMSSTQNTFNSSFSSATCEGSGLPSHPVQNLHESDASLKTIPRAMGGSPMRDSAMKQHALKRVTGSESARKSRSRTGGWSAEDPVFDDLDPLG